jgi:hypothetical protein
VGALLLPTPDNSSNEVKALALNIREENAFRFYTAISGEPWLVGGVRWELAEVNVKVFTGDWGQ